jgi:hypothetical protein
MNDEGVVTIDDLFRPRQASVRGSHHIESAAYYPTLSSVGDGGASFTACRVKLTETVH